MTERVVVPAPGWILGRRVFEEHRTANGLILVHGDNGQGEDFEVTHVGPGACLPNGEREHVDVRVGDRVRFTGEALSMPVGSETIYMLRHSQIVCALRRLVEFQS